MRRLPVGWLRRPAPPPSATLPDPAATLPDSARPVAPAATRAPARPRHPSVRHRVLVPTETAAAAAAAAVRIGLPEQDAVSMSWTADANGAWVLTILDLDPPDLVGLPVVTAWLDTVARSAGGEYGGWEPLPESSAGRA